jgi:hypothetical protein
MKNLAATATYARKQMGGMFPAVIIATKLNMIVMLTRVTANYRFPFLIFRNTFYPSMALILDAIINKQTILAAGPSYARANRQDLAAIAAVAVAVAIARHQAKIWY